MRYVKVLGAQDGDICYYSQLDEDSPWVALDRYGVKMRDYGYDNNSIMKWFFEKQVEIVENPLFEIKVKEQWPKVWVNCNSPMLTAFWLQLDHASKTYYYSSKTGIAGYHQYEAINGNQVPFGKHTLSIDKAQKLVEYLSKNTTQECYRIINE